VLGIGTALHRFILCVRGASLVIDHAAILAEIPFGRKTLQVVAGGMSVPAIYVEQFGDKNEDIVAVLAAVTLSVDIV
jgi:uncharacterized protein (TIGR02058 family)